MDWHVVIAQILNSSYVLTFINIRLRYDTFKSRLHSYTHINTHKKKKKKADIFMHFLQFLVKLKNNYTINISSLSSNIERRTRELHTK